MPLQLLGFALSALIITALTINHSHYLLDDALIYARYISNALQGHGLVYNPGEYWDALTSPLHTYLLLATSYILGDVLMAQRILSAAFFVVSIFVASRLITEITHRHAGAISFALLSSTSIYFYTLFGLETFLYLTLIFSSLLWYQQEKYVLLAFSLSLLLLTRGEGIFLVLILCSSHIIQKKPFPPLTLWLIPLILGGLQLIIHEILYDSLLPKTLSAKIAQGTSGFWGGQFAFLSGIRMYSWYFGQKISLPFIFSAFIALYGLVKNITNRSVVLLLSYLILLVLFYITLHIPFYHWYYAPFIFSGYLFLALGIQETGKLFRRTVLRYGAITAALLFLSYITLRQYQAAQQFVQQKHALPYKEIGWWLKKHTPKNSSVAAVEVGALGWFSERKMVDILGLTSPFNAEFLAQKKLTAWTAQYDPDYMVIHKPLWPQEQAARTYLKNGGVRITEGMPKGFQLIQIKKLP